MGINDMDSTQKRKAQLEKSMFSLWLKETGDTNEEDIDHLKKCIRIAIKECLTDRQREYLMLYMSGYNQTEIAKEFGVHKSTVCRMIGRSLDKIFDRVKYANPRTLKAYGRVRKNLVRLYK